ncbi:Cd(II)/Pb(II)-responsive transcriptional regulator [Halotalea alkalilenta]|uniref:Cd(II)/Pb(II)-responsive transcriptional regulator n=1 Tax=Halotalea alkalilenta TaxID=376489 RepID=UPI00247FA1F1|nr:Cd(II)/Pb(II)-responsive transcriptional regulator [Halotalea alkalilenta]
MDDRNESAARLRIGALAKRAGCAVETIRFYEREDLLPPPARSESNYRLYSASHEERLRFIRRCRSLDMTLGEIRALLVLRDAGPDRCNEVDRLVEAHLHHVEARIRELEALRHQLVDLRGQCSGEGNGEECAILKRLEDPRSFEDLPEGATRHVSGTH